MMHQHSRPIRRALTLVELIAAMTIVSVIGSVISLVLGSAVDGYTRASTSAQLNSEIGIALDRIDQLLRSIDPSPSGGPDITALTSTSITWNTNWTLSLSDSNVLLSEAGGPASVLLADVSQLVLSARDDEHQLLTMPVAGVALQDVHRIGISITVTRRGVSETMRTMIFPRLHLTGVEE